MHAAGERRVGAEDLPTTPHHGRCMGTAEAWARARFASAQKAMASPSASHSSSAASRSRPVTDSDSRSMGDAAARQGRLVRVAEQADEVGGLASLGDQMEALLERRRQHLPY